MTANTIQVSVLIGDKGDKTISLEISAASEIYIEIDADKAPFSDNEIISDLCKIAPVMMLHDMDLMEICDGDLTITTSPVREAKIKIFKNKYHDYLTQSYF